LNLGRQFAGDRKNDHSVTQSVGFAHDRFQEDNYFRSCSGSPSQRLVRTRRIRNIREDVRINTALWQSACRILES